MKKILKEQSVLSISITCSETCVFGLAFLESVNDLEALKRKCKMSFQLISKIRSLHLPLEAYGPGSVENLTLGSRYYSVDNPNNTNQQDFFIIYFPITPVYISSFSVLIRTDVFPISWSLSMSSNNSSYVTVKESNESFCSKQYWEDYHYYSYICSKPEKMTFQIDSQNQPSSSHFVKFQIHENTWNETDYDAYKKLMNFANFELIGSFYVKFPQTLKYFPKHLTIFFIILFVI